MIEFHSFKIFQNTLLCIFAILVQIPKDPANKYLVKKLSGRASTLHELKMDSIYNFLYMNHRYIYILRLCDEFDWFIMGIWSFLTHNAMCETSLVKTATVQYDETESFD